MDEPNNTTKAVSTVFPQQHVVSLPEEIGLQKVEKFTVDPPRPPRKGVSRRIFFIIIIVVLLLGLQPRHFWHMA